MFGLGFEGGPVVGSSDKGFWGRESGGGGVRGIAGCYDVASVAGAVAVRPCRPKA